MIENSFSVIEVDNNFKSGFSQKRNCYRLIKKYIDEKNHQHTICAIFGLRRSGKTVLLKQSCEMLSDEEKDKALYIECFKNVTDFANLVNFIEKRINDGYKYFFIDEITYCNDFQRMANALSDILVDLKGAKIIVTGTDSLGLLLPSYDILYDRVEYVNTTYVSYAEYSKLTGINSIDDYIKKGSTLRTDTFDTYEKTRDFIETSIVDNIINSLIKSEGIKRYPGVLTEKYTVKDIKCEIERAINKYSQTRIYKAIRKQFKPAIIGDAKDLIIRNYPEGTKIFARLKEKEASETIADILGSREVSNIMDEDIPKIYDYLEKINVFKTLPCFLSINTLAEKDELAFISHTGMYHANIFYTLETLKNDSSWIEADDETKSLIINKGYEAEMGKLMENVIITDVYECLKTNSERWLVSKLGKEIDGKWYEVDLLVVDKYKAKSYLFEIKHSDQIVIEQSNYLEEIRGLEYIEKEFGKVAARIVLYNGKTNSENYTVPRVSAKDFLINLFDECNNSGFEFEELLKKLCNNKIGSYYSSKDYARREAINNSNEIKENFSLQR